MQQISSHRSSENCTDGFRRREKDSSSSPNGQNSRNSLGGCRAKAKKISCSSSICVSSQRGSLVRPVRLVWSKEQHEFVKKGLTGSWGSSWASFLARGSRRTNFFSVRVDFVIETEWYKMVIRVYISGNSGNKEVEYFPFLPFYSNMLYMSSNQEVT